jgi:dihydrofolate reductase
MVAVMPKLIYSMNVSLDGYMEDATGRFDWSVPDAEVHHFVNDEHRGAGAHVYGARMWETMKYWATADRDPAASPETVDFAHIWQAMPKYVASRSLSEVGHGATLVRDAAAEIERLKAGDGGPVYVSGGELAAAVIDQVDEIDVYAYPAIVTRGKPAWRVPLALALIDSRTFASGVVFSRYDVKR